MQLTPYFNRIQLIAGPVRKSLRPIGKALRRAWHLATMRRGLNFMRLNDWRAAISFKNLDELERLLLLGVAPNTYVDGKHPLEVLLEQGDAPGPMRRMTAMMGGGVMMAMDPDSGAAFMLTGKNDGADTEENVMEFGRTGAIIDLLLNNGLSVIEPMQNSDKRVVDAILNMGDALLVGKVVFAAIQQSVTTGTPYQFDALGIAEKAAAKDHGSLIARAAVRTKIEERIQRMGQIHDAVRAIINAPANKADQAFVDTHSDALAFWKNEFVGVSKETMDALFPIDPEALKAERMKAHAQANPMAAMMMNMDEGHKPDYLKTLTKEDPAAILKELEAYIGMQSFKDSMQALVFRTKYDARRTEESLPNDDHNYHTAFTGNPGVGKTSAARFKARMLHSLGLAGSRYAEMSRHNLISIIHGGTEQQVAEIIKNVDILFVDEAYALADNSQGGGRHDYGQRALDTIVAALGKRKDSFTLFMAGYREPMRRMIRSNEGLSSRIKVFEDMRDYTTEELGQILDLNTGRQSYVITPALRGLMLRGIEAERTQFGREHFGNARSVELMVQDLPERMALRLGHAASGDFSGYQAAALNTVTEDDVRAAMARRGVYQIPDAKAPVSAASRTAGDKGPWAKSTPV